MAKLYFRYGSMGSSKSANALMIKYNYEERGQNVFLLKPCIDDRDGVFVSSRIGIKAEALSISPSDDVFLLIEGYHSDSNVDCVIVDESQFLSMSNVEDLCRIVDELSIPVICYGLRTDFRGNLFEGSKWLLAWADSIEEVKTICYCGKKATMNMRLSDNKPVFHGEQVLIGGNESYVAICRKHFIENYKQSL